MAQRRNKPWHSRRPHNRMVARGRLETLKAPEFGGILAAATAAIEGSKEQRS